MPIVNSPERKLASVEIIRELHPIEGADAILAASIKGWIVVVKVGEFKTGDRVIYFEEDSALPTDDERFSFLANRGVKNVEGKDYHVLKIARLRGVYSQGLVLPVELFRGELEAVKPVTDYEIGEDVSQILNIQKWEAPIPAANGEAKGNFTTRFAMKTDAERVQNLSNSWSIIQSHKWIPTEKLDGTSLTVARDFEGNLRVNSRNWEIAEGDNMYWNVVKAFSLGDFLNPGEALQAEIVGPGINGNRQAIKEVRPFVFGFIVNRVPQGRDNWPQGLLEIAVPIVDVPMPTTPEEALRQVDGRKSIINPERLSEGIVWHEVNGQEIPALGNRAVWKAVSQKYILKSKD